MKNHQLFIYFICLVSAMGGLLFGYDWVVIGGAKPFYEEYFHIAGDEGMQALAMSIALLGCLLGATMQVSWPTVTDVRSCWCYPLLSFLLLRGPQELLRLFLPSSSLAL